MLTKLLPELIVRETRRFLHKHGKDVMIIAGTIGLVATNVLVAKATVNLIEEKNETEEPPTKKEERIMMVRHYAAPAILGVTSMGLVLAGNRKYAKTEASLISAYTALNERYLAYRNKVIAELGEERNDSLECELIEEKTSNMKIPKSYEPGFVTIYDEFDTSHGDNGFFTISMCELQDAEYQLNRMFAVKGWVSLNDFYELLGWEYTMKGEELGWGMEHAFDQNGIVWVDFSHELVAKPDGTEYYILRYETVPEAGYINN